MVTYDKGFIAGIPRSEQRASSPGPKFFFFFFFFFGLFYFILFYFFLSLCVPWLRLLLRSTAQYLDGFKST